MRKLIMLITFLISLATMIFFTMTIDQLFLAFNLGVFDFEEVLALIQEVPFEEMVSALSVILWGVFQLYGMPLVVFLVSLHGLTSK